MESTLCWVRARKTLADDLVEDDDIFFCAVAKTLPDSGWRKDHITVAEFKGESILMTGYILLAPGSAEFKAEYLSQVSAVSYGELCHLLLGWFPLEESSDESLGNAVVHAREDEFHVVDAAR